MQNKGTTMRTITAKDIAAFSTALGDYMQEMQRMAGEAEAAVFITDAAIGAGAEFEQSDLEALKQTKTRLMESDIERMKGIEKHARHCFGIVRPVWEPRAGFMARLCRMTEMEMFAAMRKNGIRLVTK
jgi:hypothetical protein